jgi:hypothetical protein
MNVALEVPRIGRKLAAGKKKFDGLAHRSGLASSGERLFDRLPRNSGSASHIYRLIRLFREDRRVSVLLPRKAGRPVGTRSISEGVEAIIQAAVREVYLVPERPTFRELVREVAARCRSRGEQPPDARTIRRRVDNIDPVGRASERMKPRKSDLRVRQWRVPFKNRATPIMICVRFTV